MNEGSDESPKQQPPNIGVEKSLEASTPEPKEEPISIDQLSEAVTDRDKAYREAILLDSSSAFLELKQIRDDLGEEEFQKRRKATHEELTTSAEQTRKRVEELKEAHPDLWEQLDKAPSGPLFDRHVGEIVGQMNILASAQFHLDGTSNPLPAQIEERERELNWYREVDGEAKYEKERKRRDRLDAESKAKYASDIDTYLQKLEQLRDMYPAAALEAELRYVEAGNHTTWQQVLEREEAKRQKGLDDAKEQRKQDVRLTDPNITFEDAFFTLSEGNPGAEKILSEVVGGNLGLLLDIDMAHLYGSKIYQAYEECGGHPNKFVKYVEEMARKRIEGD